MKDPISRISSGSNIRTVLGGRAVAKMIFTPRLWHSRTLAKFRSEIFFSEFISVPSRSSTTAAYTPSPAFTFRQSKNVSQLKNVEYFAHEHVVMAGRLMPFVQPDGPDADPGGSFNVVLPRIADKHRFFRRCAKMLQRFQKNAGVRLFHPHFFRDENAAGFKP